MKRRGNLGGSMKRKAKPADDTPPPGHPGMDVLNPRQAAQKLLEAAMLLEHEEWFFQNRIDAIGAILHVCDGGNPAATDTLHLLDWSLPGEHVPSLAHLPFEQSETEIIMFMTFVALYEGAEYPNA